MGLVKRGAGGGHPLWRLVFRRVRSFLVLTTTLLAVSRRGGLNPPCPRIDSSAWRVEHRSTRETILGCPTLSSLVFACLPQAGKGGSFRGFGFFSRNCQNGVEPPPLHKKAKRVRRGARVFSPH